MEIEHPTPPQALDSVTPQIPDIADFFTGKNVFITGATGFLGKVLVEKLLRCCPDIEMLYILVRSKKGLEPAARMDEILEYKLFDKLKKEQPDFKEKIHLIHGDILEANMGISQSDVELLCNRIDVVFHSAATTRFDEPLRLAMEMNVVAVRKMVTLCRHFKLLQSFVHISTAYANCDRSFIEETIYPVPVEPQKLLDAMEWMDDDMVNSITASLLGDKPNTYTFTKQLAEYLLVREGSDLPLAIVRPSIVGAAWKEPLPGWIDNIYGPSGLYIAAGKGLLRSMKGDYNAVADIVPVDLPVNMMIAVGWCTAVTKPTSVLIYHCTTGGINPFTWGEMEGIVLNVFKRIPLNAAFRRPNVSFTTNSLIHDYWVFVSHMIPAYLADMAFTIIGRKPRMVKTYNRLHRAIDTLDYFTSRSWEWTYQNLDMLRSQLSPRDRKLFYLDPHALHWPTYIESYCLGTKQFILNEDMAGLPAARRHLRNLRNIRYTFNTFLVVMIWRLLIARSQLAQNVWYFILSLVFKFVRYFHVTSSLRR